MWGRKIGFSGAKKVWSAFLLRGQRWVPEAELRLNEKVFSLLFFFSSPVPAGGGTGGWEDSAGLVSLQSFHAFPFPSLQK